MIFRTGLAAAGAMAITWQKTASKTALAVMAATAFMPVDATL